MIALGRLVFNTPWLLALILICASGVFGFYKGWSIEHDAKITAVAARDAEWQRKIAEANVVYEQAVAAAVADAARAPAVVTNADVERMCEQSEYCRDRGSNK